MKSFFKNPTYSLLIGSNLFCIYYYLKNPNEFGTIVWIYWWQSIIIGLFTFIEILSNTQFTGSGKLNGTPITSKNKGCLAIFFLVHYGGFHLAYLFFITVKYIRTTNFIIVLLGMSTFFIESLVSYIRRRRFQTANQLLYNNDAAFFLPYLRIIPMHLMILLPGVLGIGRSVWFLVLKTLTDLIFYILTEKFYFSKEKQSL